MTALEAETAERTAGSCRGQKVRGRKTGQAERKNRI
jgi:hypothetical protein